MNPFISLSSADLRLARELAYARFSQDRDAGVRDMLQGSQLRKIAYEVIGVCGELAFSRWVGIPFDPNQKLIPGACDFVMDGVKIDVKASDRPNGDLIVSRFCRPGRARIYVYVSGSGAHWQIVGFAPESVVFQEQYLQDLGRGPCRIIPRSDLYDPAQLRQAVKQFSQKRNELRTQPVKGTYDRAAIT